MNACTYDYTLPAGVTQLKVYINSTAGGTYHLYGLTNEEAGPDETAPVVETLSPPDDETPAVGDAAYPGTNLVATFDEDIALTGIGTITITDNDDGSGTQTINLPNASVVTVSGADLIIDPASNLEFGTNYSVQISADAIEDLADTPNAFAGIADSTTWNFITAAVDGTPPDLAAVDPFNPADGAADVLLDSTLSVTFNENILTNSAATQILLNEDFEAGNGGFAPSGTPNDWAWGPANSDNSAGLILTGGNGSPTGKCWATNLGTGGNPSGTIDNTANSILHSPKSAGSGIDLTGVVMPQFQFAAAIDAATGDTIEIVVRDVDDDSALVTLTPFTPEVSANWATYGPFDISAAAGQEVYLEFRYAGTNNGYIGLYIDDVMVTGVGADNVITLKDLTNTTDTIIPIDDSSQISVNGSTLTIHPAATLAPLSNYAVQIGSTAIRNYNELNFAGIADTTSWNFATIGPVTLTWDPSGGGTSDGGGTWLDTGKWWNGTANGNWGNSTPDNAVIGNGGAGGNITLGTVNAGTVLFDNFTGTYALKSGSLDQNDGITIGANAGNVSLESPVSGTGGVTVNGPSRVNFRSGAKTFTGDIIIDGSGEVLEYNMDMGTGNLTLNDGVLVDYWAGNMNRTLGPGPGQVQMLGGASGFCGQGANGVTIRLNNSDDEVVWGSTYFNPSTLVLQSPWANTNGKLTWRNQLDLNGAMRTIKVNKDHEGRLDGYANMISPITNNAGTAAGLIKEGPGRLILAAANTYDGGTQVTNGFLAVNGSLANAAMIISGGTVNGSGTLTFNAAGATIDQIVMTGGTLDATGLTVNVNGTLTATEYVLVDATGGGSISGTFAGLTGAPGYTLDYGTTNQVKLVGPGGGSAYDTWKATNAPTGNPDDDYDLDGVSNAVEFVVGGLAATNDLDKLPAISTSGGNLLFTFKRNQDSIDGTTSVVIEVGTDLSAWPSAYTVGADTAGSDPGVTVSKNDPAAGTDTVTLSVAQDATKKFARLKVVIAP